MGLMTENSTHPPSIVNELPAPVLSVVIPAHNEDRFIGSLVLAAGLVTWHEPVEGTGAAAGIVIEFAPMPVAPATVQSEVRPGPEMDTFDSTPTQQVEAKREQKKQCAIVGAMKIGQTLPHGERERGRHESSRHGNKTPGGARQKGEY
jgi:hypothetical protein